MHSKISCSLTQQYIVSRGKMDTPSELLRLWKRVDFPNPNEEHLWFYWYQLEQAVEQPVVLPVIWDDMTLMQP